MLFDVPWFLCGRCPALISIRWLRVLVFLCFLGPGRYQKRFLIVCAGILKPSWAAVCQLNFFLQKVFVWSAVLIITQSFDPRLMPGCLVIGGREKSLSAPKRKLCGGLSASLPLLFRPSKFSILSRCRKLTQSFPIRHDGALIADNFWQSLCSSLQHDICLYLFQMDRAFTLTWFRQNSMYGKRQHGRWPAHGYLCIVKTWGKILARDKQRCPVCSCAWQDNCEEKEREKTQVSPLTPRSRQSVTNGQTINEGILVSCCFRCFASLGIQETQVQGKSTLGASKLVSVWLYFQLYSESLTRILAVESQALVRVFKQILSEFETTVKTTTCPVGPPFQCSFFSFSCASDNPDAWGSYINTIRHFQWLV